MWLGPGNRPRDHGSARCADPLAVVAFRAQATHAVREAVGEAGGGAFMGRVAIAAALGIFAHLSRVFHARPTIGSAHRMGAKAAAGPLRRRADVPARIVPVFRHAGSRQAKAGHGEHRQAQDKTLHDAPQRVRVANPMQFKRRSCRSRNPYFIGDMEIRRQPGAGCSGRRWRFNAAASHPNEFPV